MNAASRFAASRLIAGLFALFLLATFLLPASALGQSADTAALEVYLSDVSKANIVGAKLHLMQKEQNLSRDAVTDKQGHYRFTALPVGSYVLTVEKEGFGTVSQEGIKLAVTQEATFNIVLHVAQSTTEITVNTETPMLDVDRTTIGQTISQEELENLPSDNRNYLDFALTVPGITAGTDSTGSGLSANGGRQRSNSLLVDGVENNGFLNGNFRQSVSLDAVSQFQVMTNQFLPEYGQAAGAVINMVTKSGTDNQHGDVYYYVRNPALNAASKCTEVTCAPSNFERNDFGATYGRPIFKNRTFLFASGEYIGQSQYDSNYLGGSSEGTVLQTVNQALAYGYVLGTSVKSVNGAPVYSSYPQTLGSVRVDHRIDDRDTVLARLLYAHYTYANPKADSGDGGYSDYSNYGKDHLHAYSLMGEWTHIFSPTLLNEFHFQYAPQQLVSDPNSSGPSVTISSQIEFGQNTGLPLYLNETHYEWTDGLTKTKGNHLFKFGTDDEIVNAYTSYPIDFTGHFAFTDLGTFKTSGGAVGPSTCTSASISTFACGYPYEYIQTFGTPNINLTDKLVSFYAEDSWKALRRVTVNYGVRYDLDLQPKGYNGNGSDPVQAPLPKAIPRDYDNIAPRVGVAWALNNKGNWVLNAGWGMFYDKIFLILGRDALLTRVTLDEYQSGYTNLHNQWLNGPYPTSYTYPTALAALAETPSITSVHNSLSIPVTHEATLFLDHQFPMNLLLDVGGLFVSGQHLLRSDNSNLAPPVISSLANEGALGLTTGGTTTSQELGRPYFGAGRVNSNYNDITAYGSYGHSTYSALHATIQQRSYHGLTLRASWVWSKAIDDGSDFTVEPSNPAFPQGDKSLSSQDQRNLFVSSFVYRIPYQTHGLHNSPLRWVLGSWIVSGIYIQGSGQPENITTGTDSNGDGNASDRPFINGTNGVCTYDATACPNAGAVPIMAPRNSFRGARHLNNQARVQREFSLPHGSRLIFSAEAFNAVNHSYVTYFNPYWGNSVAPSTSYGQPDGWSSPRSIQLGMKAVF